MTQPPHISPDGGYQWDGTSWVPVPPPQRPKAPIPLKGCLAIVGVLFVVGLIALGARQGASPPTASTPAPSPKSSPSAVVVASPTPTAKSTSAPTPTAAPTAAVYPPTTLAGLQALAKTGDASQIHEFHSEGTGLASCPEPRRSVTVDPSITGQQLASDLLAYFFAQGLNNNCGSLVLGYHSTSEGSGAYTAGRVDLTIRGSSKVLTVDAGADHFTVTY